MFSSDLHSVIADLLQTEVHVCMCGGEVITNNRSMLYTCTCVLYTCTCVLYMQLCTYTVGATKTFQLCLHAVR